MRGVWVITVAVCLTAAAGAQSSADDLFQAIRNDDLTFLKAQLAKGADVNTRDKRGTTLLMDAASFGSPEALKLLLDSGADVNAKNQFDNTALILGAHNPEKARLLVARGADVNAHTKPGRTALMLAARCDGCSETVRLLLEKGADAKAKDSRAVTAMHVAADSNDLETVKLLLSKGAEADPLDAMGDTPLMSAAMNCSLDGVKLFLSKGANVNAVNTASGEVKFGKIQLIKLSSLMLAAPYCQADLMKVLLAAGASVNATDIRGMTPLMLAVASENQDLAVVRLLLKNGAEVNARSLVNETALDWAKKFGNREVIAALTEAGGREGTPYAPPQRAAGRPQAVRDAVVSSTALLVRASSEFFKQSGCVGCHHQPVTTMALAAARESGSHIDEAAAKEYIRMMDSEATGFQEIRLEDYDTGGGTDPPVYALMARGAMKTPPSPITDILVRYIANFQHRDGAWRLGGAARAPIEEGVIGRTALNMRALQVYGFPAEKAGLAMRIERSRKFLAAAKPVTNDDAAMQLAGLHWAGTSADQLRPLGKALIARQRADGGWAQNPNLSSDAFATGESLWALKEAGMLTPSDPVYQRGVKFLLDTQWQDGSWYVRSRAPKFQPYFQSGFPFDHDQWISSTATAWAVIALAPAIEKEKRASR